MPAARGIVVFPPDMGSFEGAVVHVRLLDVTLADAPARVLAEETITDVSHAAGVARELAFQVRGDPLSKGADAIVAVHVDLRGDGQIRPGDYITTEAYPVSPAGETTGMMVRLKRVS